MSYTSTAVITIYTPWCGHILPRNEQQDDAEYAAQGKRGRWCPRNEGYRQHQRECEGIMWHITTRIGLLLLGGDSLACRWEMISYITTKLGPLLLGGDSLACRWEMISYITTKLGPLLLGGDSLACRWEMISYMRQSLAHYYLEETVWPADEKWFLTWDKAWPITT